MAKQCIIILIGLAFFSCTTKGLREAKTVVSQADSLRAIGMSYRDSMQLAQTYSTLHAWRYIYKYDYAHACYHYGRLLRDRDNPVEAMQCFINATHSRSHDYALLGRVYSNMGSLAHLAGEFNLSYDMYEHCADMFLKIKDSTAYYYALNDMAFELAEQGKKGETLVLLAQIENTIQNENLQAKILETKAEMYLKCQQYDSVLLCLQIPGKKHNSPTILLTLGQTYSYLGIKDSAVYYATIVLSCSKEPNDINNALYIMTNDDDAKDLTGVRETASDRADAQKLIEIRQGKLSQATQLLHQDLTRKTDFRWLYAIMVTLTIIGTGIWAYVSAKRKKHGLLSQKVEALTNTYTNIRSAKAIQIEQNCKFFQSARSLYEDFCWRDFGKMCKIADSSFYWIASKLKQTKLLNEQEIRLCILVLLDYRRKQIADVLPYAQNGIGKLKYRVAKKLGTEGKDLRKYLISLAIDDTLNTSSHKIAHIEKCVSY